MPLCAFKNNIGLCIHTCSIYLSIYLSIYMQMQTQIIKYKGQKYKIKNLFFCMVYNGVLLVRHHDGSIDWQRHEGYDIIWDGRHPWFRVAGGATSRCFARGGSGESTAADAQNDRPGPMDHLNINAVVTNEIKGCQRIG